MKKKKIIKYIKENRKTIILAVSLVLFTIITYAIFSDKIDTLDKNIHSYILNIRNENLTSILITITNISSAYALIVLSILLLLIMKKKKIPLLICLNLIISFLTNQIAKLTFSRPRPVGINLIEESGYSYPSGHAMISMAYFGFIAYLIYKSNLNKIIKLPLITSIFILILLIGFSRIYLGVHYLSDIIGGFLLSIAYIMIFINCIKIKKAGRKWKQLE